MQHYFIETEHMDSDFFEFNDSIFNFNLTLKSCNNMFSKNKIDDGTRALLEAIGKKCPLAGFGLDVGCGLGVISIALIKKFNVKMEMIDVVDTAISLSKENLIKNNVQHNAVAYKSNGFENVKNNFDFVVTNPPIKTGKTLLFNLMEGAYNHLNSNGTLVLVIRKDHGMESLKKHLQSLFGNCEILDRNKGYYILKSTKN